ncbi:unnamed protein product [Litomosoides sigmodontis]|uniref:Uncharacterized protein n=1 Tax=Litomosoides sigmodontis TaxID=42156 RepID=A0A3P6SX09_LITSI|nr:unnamed protein product [Litomosoides sigmodontis]
MAVECFAATRTTKIRCGASECHCWVFLAVRPACFAKSKICELSTFRNMARIICLLLPSMIEAMITLPGQIPYWVGGASAGSLFGDTGASQQFSNLGLFGLGGLGGMQDFGGLHGFAGLQGLSGLHGLGGLQGLGSLQGLRGLHGFSGFHALDPFQVFGGSQGFGGMQQGLGGLQIIQLPFSNKKFACRPCIICPSQSASTTNCAPAPKPALQNGQSCCCCAPPTGSGTGNSFNRKKY